MRKSITEAKDIALYKNLLNVFGDWCDKFPASSVDRLFEILVEQGKKILPDDKRALAILDFVLEDNKDSVPAAVQKILNLRFRDLPAQLKPIAWGKPQMGRRHEIAFWNRDSKVFDQVKSLLNFEGGGKGFWSDVEGEKVTLLDTEEKKND